ncbi:DUF1326 domain-containing protein [Arthrobacter sp. UYEF21]|uniref:DUF1326 domain-containing protein n=1 Tax=Arthrobacter sp. UYEF21 TaxID=1756364 RepID=UPI003392D0CE
MDGECRGLNVFHVAKASLDDTDLSGVDFAFLNWFPTHLTAVGWKVGAVVDDAATILRGQAGGPFGDLAGLYGEWLGLERASVTFTDGDRPSGSVAGHAQFTFELLPGPDGGVTTVKNAMYGFAPEFRIGEGPGLDSSASSSTASTAKRRTSHSPVKWPRAPRRPGPARRA